MRLALIATASLAIVLVGCEERTLDESLTDLEVGECVTDPGEGVLLELEKADCSEPGTVEVVSRFEVTGHDDFPGDAELDQIAQDRCATSAAVWLVPTEESWEGADDRLIICFD